MAETDGLNAGADGGQTVLGGSPEQQAAPVDGDGSQVDPNGSAQQQAEGSVEQSPKWLEQAPRDLRDRLAGLGHKEYRAFMEDALGFLEKKDSLIQKPTEDASKEQWDQYWQSVGRPESPDGYELPDAEKYGDISDAFKKAAHEMGLTTQQAQNLFQWYGEQDKALAEKRIAESQEEVQKVQEQLKTDWGDKFDAQMKNIDRFKKKYGNDELVQELQNPAVGNNVALIKALAQAGADLASDSLIEGQTKTSSGEKKPYFTYKWMEEAYPKKDF